MMSWTAFILSYMLQVRRVKIVQQLIFDEM